MTHESGGRLSRIRNRKKKKQSTWTYVHFTIVTLVRHVEQWPESKFENGTYEWNVSHVLYRRHSFNFFPLRFVYRPVGEINFFRGGTGLSGNSQATVVFLYSCRAASSLRAHLPGNQLDRANSYDSNAHENIILEPRFYPEISAFAHATYYVLFTFINGYSGYAKY